MQSLLRKSFVVELLSRFLIFWLLILVIADIFRDALPGLASLGNLAWIISWFFMGGLSFYAFWELLRKKRMFTVLTVSLIVGLLVSQASSVTSLSGETAIEMNCGIGLWQDLERGVTPTCMFGYPTRQYLVPSLPSLLFGRIQMMLNLGSVIYLSIGFVILSWGIHTFWSKHKGVDFLAAIVLLLISQSLIFWHLAFFYEQSIYPVALAALVTGLGLINLASGKRLWRILFIWSLIYCLFTYTPSLPIFLLGYVGLLWIFLSRLKRRKYEWFTGFTLCLLLLLLFVSLSVRNDLHLSGNYYAADQSIGNLKEDLYTVGKHLVFQSQGTAYMTSVGWGVFVVLLISMSLGWGGWKGFLLILWAWVFIVGVVFAEGYSIGSIAYRFHRFTAIFPVLFTYQLLFLSRWKQKKVLGLIWIGLLFYSVLQVGTFVRHQPIKWQAVIYQTVERDISLKSTHEPLTAMIEEEGLPMEVYSLKDTFGYFYPGFAQELVTADCLSLRDKLFKRPLLIILTTESTNCDSVLNHEYTVSSIYDPKNEGGEVMKLYARKDLLIH